MLSILEWIGLVIAFWVEVFGILYVAMAIYHDHQVPAKALEAPDWPPPETGCVAMILGRWTDYRCGENPEQFDENGDGWCSYHLTHSSGMLIEEMEGWHHPDRSIEIWSGALQRLQTY